MYNYILQITINLFKENRLIEAVEISPEALGSTPEKAIFAYIKAHFGKIKITPQKEYMLVGETKLNSELETPTKDEIDKNQSVFLAKIYIKKCFELKAVPFHKWNN